TLIASGVALADGRNEAIAVTGLTAGATYKVRVTAEGGTNGEYFFTKNFSPVVTSLAATSPINENDTATLNGTLSDPDVLDTHTVVIPWGPGEGSTPLTLAAGMSSFSASHQYLDDTPSGTPSDAYAIGVTLTDNHGASGTAATSVTVNNVAPTVTSLNGAASISENDTYTLSGTFHDAGTLDTHTVVITWGGGTPGQPAEGSTTLNN